MQSFIHITTFAIETVNYLLKDKTYKVLSLIVNISFLCGEISEAVKISLIYIRKYPLKTIKKQKN